MLPPINGQSCSGTGTGYHTFDKVQIKNYLYQYRFCSFRKINGTCEKILVALKEIIDVVDNSDIKVHSREYFS